MKWKWKLHVLTCVKASSEGWPGFVIFPQITEVPIALILHQTNHLFLCNHNASVKSHCPDALYDSWRKAAVYLWTSGRWPTARRCQWQRWCLYRGRWPLKGWMAELWWAWASSGHIFLNSVCLVSMTPPTRRMRERQTQKSVRNQQKSTTVTLSALVLEVFSHSFSTQIILFLYIPRDLIFYSLI